MALFYLAWLHVPTLLQLCALLFLGTINQQMTHLIQSPDIHDASVLRASRQLGVPQTGTD